MSPPKAGRKEGTLDEYLGMDTSGHHSRGSRLLVVDDVKEMNN